MSAFVCDVEVMDLQPPNSVISLLRRSSYLLHDYVRCREEHSDSGYYRKQREDDQTEPIHDHGSEFPIANQVLLLVPFLHAARDELQLLQDKVQVLVRAPAHRMLLNGGRSAESGEGKED